MAPLALTGSVMGELQGEDRFDCIQAFKLAMAEGCDAFQIYLDERFREERYRTRFIQVVREYLQEGRQISFVGHMMNATDLQLADILAAKIMRMKLRNLTKDSEVRLDLPLFIHYEDGINWTKIASDQQLQFGFENSLTGNHSFTHHVWHVTSAMRNRLPGQFFVFDFGRMLYMPDAESIRAAQHFILQVISMMDPATDVLHLTGKTSWEKKFRDCSAATWAEDDIGLFAKESILQFEHNGGMIVFEHERVDEVQQSLENFKREKQAWLARKGEA